jgi:hypothetical protein
MSALESRLVKLEQAAPRGRHAFIWCDRSKQTEAEAIAEHVESHPADKEAEFTVFSWLVAEEVKA